MEFSAYEMRTQPEADPGSVRVVLRRPRRLCESDIRQLLQGLGGIPVSRAAIRLHNSYFLYSSVSATVQAVPVFVVLGSLAVDAIHGVVR